MRLSGVAKRCARGGPWILRRVELVVDPGKLVRPAAFVEAMLFGAFAVGGALVMAGRRTE